MKIATIDVARMKQYIFESGLKQSWLASEAGMTLNALNLALNKKRGLQSSEYFSLCSVLGVPFEQFLTVADDGGAA